MSTDTLVDAVALREEVKDKYRDVALDPHGEFHFHTGRPLAKRLGYDDAVVGAMPDAAVESFAGVANPFSLRPLEAGERVVDMGSGADFDCFIAAQQVGPQGQVIGIYMTREMLTKSRDTAQAMGLDQVEFREGILEELPVDDGQVDVVIANGVLNLCSDKQQVFSEIWRILRPGGVLQFADIANGQPVPEAAVSNIDLWTALIAGGMPCAGWQKMMRDTGFVELELGPAIDTFAGAGGEPNARKFEVFGYPFLGRKP